MDTQTIDAFRRRLLNRRESLLQQGGRMLADEQKLLEDRERDKGDLPAHQTGTARLDALADREARALEQIQASLERIARGTFGNCVVCRGAIETERLRAIPEIDRCSGCTH